LILAGCVLLAVGCARAPGGQGSGVRLVVTLRFAGEVKDNYQYFFLIRNGNDSVGQNGPIPIIEPPYLNGFATGQVDTTAGFTDFVEYSRVQRQATASGYAVYHVPGGISGDPNTNIFQARGEPEFTVPPSGSTVLQFELDLSRLQPGSGEPDPNNGQTPRYLQINLVATTTTPTDPQTVDPDKFLDAFGEQRLASGTFNAYVTIDAAQIGREYRSSNTPGDPYFEPDNDTFPGPSDPAVELVAWSVRITGR